jgi:hypothetical protein
MSAGALYGLWAPAPFAVSLLGVAVMSAVVLWRASGRKAEGRIPSPTTNRIKPGRLGKASDDDGRHGRLAGKVAIVTGGAQGIGRGPPNGSSRRGARVLVSDIQVEKGEATVAAINAVAPEGAGATFIKADILEPAEIEAMVAHAVELYGRLDILVNNAYWNCAGGTAALTIGLDDWNKAQAAMVTAPRLGGRSSRPAHGGGWRRKRSITIFVGARPVGGGERRGVRDGEGGV